MLQQEQYPQNIIHKRLMSGSLWALSGKIVAALLGLAVNFLLAKILSPKELGTYFLALSMVGMGVTLAGMGLQQTVVRLVAEYLSKNRMETVKKILLKSFALSICGGLVTAVVLVSGPGEWIAIHLLSSELLAHSLPVIGALLILTVVQMILAESFRGFSDILQATLFGGLMRTACTTVFFHFSGYFPEAPTFRLYYTDASQPGP